MISIQLRLRDKLALGGALALLTATAWISTFHSSLMMNLEPTQLNMTGTGANPAGLKLLLYFTTWMVMMIAMMLPSAAPMILTYSVVSQKQRSGVAALGNTFLFTLGYLLSWGSLGVLAFGVDSLLPRLAPFTGELDQYTSIIAGSVLILVGAYQFSILKDVCLKACRIPLGYLLTHWRKGSEGAVRMGVQHGLYCIGCCWVLMVLLFVVGIMNLAWMAAISLLIFVEKVSRQGVNLSKALGAIFILAGLAMTVHGIL